MEYCSGRWKLRIWRKKCLTSQPETERMHGRIEDQFLWVGKLQTALVRDTHSGAGLRGQPAVHGVQLRGARFSPATRKSPGEIQKLENHPLGGETKSLPREVSFSKRSPCCSSRWHGTEING